MLVTPVPIPGLPIGDEPLALEEGQVARWEERSRAPVIAMSDVALDPFANEDELAARQSLVKLLKGRDTLPSRIYVLKAKQGAPFSLQVKFPK